jgi:hypothetical protein
VDVVGGGEGEVFICNGFETGDALFLLAPCVLSLWEEIATHIPRPQVSETPCNDPALRG